MGIVLPALPVNGIVILVLMAARSSTRPHVRIAHSCTDRIRLCADPVCIGEQCSGLINSQGARHGRSHRERLVAGHRHPNSVCSGHEDRKEGVVGAYLFLPRAQILTTPDKERSQIRHR